MQRRWIRPNLQSVWDSRTATTQTIFPRYFEFVSRRKVQFAARIHARMTSNFSISKTRSIDQGFIVEASSTTLGSI